jgi:hypothetical protein
LRQHLLHAELLVLGVADPAPQSPAALAQPGVERFERAKLALLRIEPDAPAAVLYVLFHHAFFPARGHVAEIGIEQVVRAHHGKARIDHAALAFLDLVHRRFHVVIDAAPGNAAERREGARVGIEQHFMALAGVGHQPESAARAQLEVRDLHLVVNAAH